MSWRFKLVLVAAVAIAVAWEQNAASGEAQVWFRFAKADRGDVVDAVTATGTLNAVTTVQVGTQVSGRISRWFSDYNDHVKKDQVLALVDTSIFEAQLESAKASVAKSTGATAKSSASVDVAGSSWIVAKADVNNAVAALKRGEVAADFARRAYNRQKTLRDQHYVAQQDMDNAEAEMRKTEADLGALDAQIHSAEAKAAAAKNLVAQARADFEANQGDLAQQMAALKLAQTNLGYCKIISPIAGIVISREIDIGQTVAASFNTPLLYQIADDLTRMQITANVDEADIGRVKTGQEVTFTVDAFPDRRFAGKVSQIRLAPIVTQNVVTYHVIVDVPNPDLALMPGMTSNASILIARRKGALRVPNAALAFNPAVVKEDGSAGPGNRAPDAKATVVKPKPLDDSVPLRDAEGHKPGTVYPANGLLVAPVLKVKVGISDGTYSEVLSDQLKEGDRIAIGITHEAPAGAKTSLFDIFRRRGPPGGGGPRL